MITGHYEIIIKHKLSGEIIAKEYYEVSGETISSLNQQIYSIVVHIMESFDKTKTPWVAEHRIRDYSK